VYVTEGGLLQRITQNRASERCLVAHDGAVVQHRGPAEVVQASSLAMDRLHNGIAGQDAVGDRQQGVVPIGDSATAIERRVARDGTAAQRQMAARVVDQAAAPPLAPVVADRAVDQRRRRRPAVVEAAAEGSGSVAGDHAISDDRAAGVIVEAAAVFGNLRSIGVVPGFLRKGMSARDRESIEYRRGIRTTGDDDVKAVVRPAGVVGHVVEAGQRFIVLIDVSAEHRLIGHDVAQVWIHGVGAGISTLENHTFGQVECGIGIPVAVSGALVGPVRASRDANLAAFGRGGQGGLEMDERVGPAQSIVAAGSARIDIVDTLVRNFARDPDFKGKREGDVLLAAEQAPRSRLQRSERAVQAADRIEKVGAVVVRRRHELQLDRLALGVDREPRLPAQGLLGHAAIQEGAHRSGEGDDVRIRRLDRLDGPSRRPRRPGHPGHVARLREAAADNHGRQ